MGRKYYVLWIGNTKHGKLARLSSKDGRLDFWVDVDNIEELIISENIKLGADNFAHWYYNTSWSYAKKNISQGG